MTSVPFIIEVGYSPKQLAERVNKKVADGYKPLGSHSLIYLPDGDVWEYSVSMFREEVDDGSS